jgi:predicted NBD/HSP70 family sugar kinase
VRAVNESSVLEAILKRAPISRSELGRLLGLSKPTISSIMSRLETAGLVIEHSSQISGTGRPATMYELNPQAGYVIGMDLGGSTVRAVLADLYGDVVRYTESPVRADSADSLVRQVRELRDQLLTSAGIAGDLLVAAGIGVPGILDSSGRTVRAAYNVPVLAELDLRSDFGAALGVPITVENDVNLAAIGEGWRGCAVGCRNFALIAVGTGIGMGIVLDGELYRGPSGAAGEIDFLPLSVDQPAVGGHHGPLERVVSGPAVIKRYRSTTRRRTKTVSDIVAAAERGDEDAVRAVREIARALAFAISAVVCVLDPERVVLGGGVGSIAGLLQPVRDVFREMSASEVLIETGGLAGRATAYGALAVALRDARQRLLDGKRAPSSAAPESRQFLLPLRRDAEGENWRIDV